MSDREEERKEWREGGEEREMGRDGEGERERVNQFRLKLCSTDEKRILEFLVIRVWDSLAQINVHQ